jgi:glycosyltransferase involved in cell wall biosynthesis
MKILFLEQFSELGGGQRNLLDLLPAVVARGWKAVVAAPGTGPLFERARAAGAETLAIPLGNYSNSRKSAMDAARFPIDTILLSRWIARQDCDLIGVGGARLLPAVAMAARGRRVIFQAQHFFEEARALKLARWAIRKSRAEVVANSKHVASQFENARVVYNGVEEVPFVAHEFGEPWRLGIIGRIAPMKGQSDFLRAAAILASMLPLVTLNIYGKPMFTPPAYVEEVHRLAASLPVHFSGWRDDIGAVLGELNLLIVPSTAAEATTRVILEAFSAGVPVVAYAAGGIPEIIRDRETGFLVPERTPEALAQKILEVTKLDLPRVALQARKEWESHYTVNRYREQMMEVISPIPASHTHKTS